MRIIQDKFLRVLAVASVSWAVTCGIGLRTAEGAIVMDALVIFDSGTSLYTYEYTVSRVDVGRKVTGVTWVIIEGVNLQPVYLPASWNIPLFWNILPGNSGPCSPCGAWLSNTASNETGDLLLAGETANFSFTTGYAPRDGRYFITENELGSEINFNQIFGNISLPNYDGSLIETLWTGQDTLNAPPPSPVPLPAALPLFLSALAGLGLMGWRRRTA